MRIIRLLFASIACAALSGCVLGYGPCLFLQPVTHEFVGVVHFHDYPAPDGIDNVPVLALDTTAYVYAPAQSHRCRRQTICRWWASPSFPGTSARIPTSP